MSIAYMLDKVEVNSNRSLAHDGSAHLNTRTMIDLAKASETRN
jgi:hypothetical protein